MEVEKPLESVLLHFEGDVVFPADGGSSFPGAVGVEKADGVADLFERVVGLLEFGFGLGGKSDDDVGSESLSSVRR